MSCIVKYGRNIPYRLVCDIIVQVSCTIKVVQLELSRNHLRYSPTWTRGATKMQGPWGWGLGTRLISHLIGILAAAYEESLTTKLELVMIFWCFMPHNIHPVNKIWIFGVCWLFMRQGKLQLYRAYIYCKTKSFTLGCSSHCRHNKVGWLSIWSGVAWREWHCHSVDGIGVMNPPNLGPSKQDDDMKGTWRLLHVVWLLLELARICRGHAQHWQDVGA
jgi:hypothetical protein